ncbi:MAG: dephospho-CoA kinase [Fibrobacter sp.]|nr:dephospho-CoA kinase [Fibrobacter sp.]
MNTLKIGLAGYMGAGKSTCSEMFAGRDAAVIDADREAKVLMRNDCGIKRKLVETFGSEVICNGEISFARLGAFVFDSIVNIRKLNSIVHPPLLEHLYRLLNSIQEPIVVLDASLIPLWNIDNWFDLRLWVDASEETRLERVYKRSQNSLPKEQIKERMLIQQELFQAPSEECWDYILNDGNVDVLRNAVDRICENIRPEVLS